MRVDEKRTKGTPRKSGLQDVIKCGIIKTERVLSDNRGLGGMTVEEKVKETLRDSEKLIKDLNYETGVIVSSDGMLLHTETGNNNSVSPPAELITGNMIQINSNTQHFVDDFLKMVMPPGEQKGMFDERITFNEAIEFAQKTESAYGEPLMQELIKMKEAKAKQTCFYPISRFL